MKNHCGESVGFSFKAALWFRHWFCLCETFWDSLQSRRFLTKTRRYIDRGRHLEKQRKRLRGRGFFPPLPSPSPILNPSTSPLKTLFDSSQLSGSINVQDGGTTSFLKTIHGSRPKIRLLCRLFLGLRFAISTVKCNDSGSLFFLFVFFFFVFFLKDRIASFQLKQIVVFLKCSVCVFKLISSAWLRSSLSIELNLQKIRSEYCMQLTI